MRGSLCYPFIERRRSANLQILVYHRVNDERDPFFPGVPTQDFMRQMEYLAAEYTVLALGEAVERMKCRDLPDRSVVVTFDDGYRDNYMNAFPVLQALKIPATVFVATGVIGTDKMLWHDKVFDAFRRTQALELQGFDSVPNGSLASVRERVLALHRVLGVLRSLGSGARLGAIERLLDRLEVTQSGRCERLMLNWAEIRVMQAGGIEIGSHTVTHPILAKATREEVRAEVYESKRCLEDVLRLPVESFAYPGGRRNDFDEVATCAVRDAGYRSASTAIFGTNDCGSDRFELYRGGPWEHDPATFAAKLVWHKFWS